MLRHALLIFYNTADIKRWIDSVISEQGRYRNVIPMEPTFHGLFDRFQVTLRPVECYLDPKKRI
jgi:hypothetical protein